MTLPSIERAANDLGVDLKTRTKADGQRVLVEAMRRDLPLATHYLEAKAREAQRTGKPVSWLEDPASPLGKQLIRMHASDAMRPLASTYFCGGMRLSFLNCCRGTVGEPPKETKDDEEAELIDLQIKLQDGTIANADC